MRGFNYVDDVVDALLIAATDSRLRGDYFNLGGERPVTLEAFVQLLLRITGRGSYRIVPFPSEKKVIDIGSVYTSAAKFNAATGWTPCITLEEGLTRTVDYYRRCRAHYW